MKNIIFHITFDPWRPQMLGHTTSFKKGMVIKMKNGVIPYSMWVLFAPTFRKHLPILGITEGKSVMKRAKAKYRSIIKDIPSFGKNDILLVNLLSAAQIAAVYLSLDEKPPLEQMTEYYNLSMDDSRIMRIFLKSTDYYSVGYQKKLARQAEQSQLSDNPYSWRFKFFAGQSLDAFDAIFDRCGICRLFSDLGISEITPAMCRYDYGMAKWTKNVFTREYTLASGGRICDCHYKRKNQ